MLNQYGLWAAVHHYFGGQGWPMWLFSPLIAVQGLSYLGMLVGVVTLTRRRAGFLLALLLSPIAYFSIIAGAASNPRFRAPVMPHICLLAGTGLVTVCSWVRRHLHLPY